MTEIYLVRQDKCPRHPEDQGVFVFTDLELARVWTKTVDIADHTRTRDMVLERDGPDTDVQCFERFIKWAGVMESKTADDPEDVWRCGDGWHITKLPLNPGVKELLNAGS